MQFASSESSVIEDPMARVGMSDSQETNCISRHLKDNHLKDSLSW